MRAGLAPAADLVRALAGEPAAALPVERCPAPCGARLHGPERDRGTCDPCAALAGRSGWCERLLARIPLAFRWADLRRPLVPPDSKDGRAVVSEEGRAAAAAWVADPAQRILTVVASELRGGAWGAVTGAGKTTLVGGIGGHWARAGEPFEWVHAHELDWTNADHEANLRRALRAPRLILDGIGQDLGTAKGESGVSAQRAPGVQRVLLEIHQGRGPKLAALTVDFTRDELSAGYGGGITRRITANSSTVQVLRLTRVKRPDYVEF